MEKDENFSESGFTGIDHYSHHHHQHLQDHLMKSRAGQTSDNDNNNNIDNNHEMIDYTLSIFPPRQQQQLLPSGFCASTSLDKLSFADVMQFADFGPKLALNQTKIPEEEPGIDPGFFLRFPVLNQKLDNQVQPLMVGDENEDMRLKGIVIGSEEQGECREDEEARVSDNTSVQLRFLSDEVENKIIGSSSAGPEVKNKRKRPRTVKTSEEVESQRMTHIAVERNRRKQMNEHLRVLRSLMPGSYVQRGDQASIIGGAIEFVRELEQLLQCLESQKRRRMLGDSASLAAVQQPQQPPFFGGDQSMKLVGFDGGLREERAENKSCVADVEVKLLGFDAMIKVLSRRRPGQLIKAIAALEDLQLNILHTNITTIEQTVLYSFNVKVGSETRCSAEDIATSVQQIFTFIHANTSTM